MIKIEHTVFPSPDQMEFIIEGMRNPMNSWEKSDSIIIPGGFDGELEKFDLGEDDERLMLKLAKSGTDHRKYMRMMQVYVRITAPLYWWKEFDTYKIGTVSNSCSTMHKITDKEFVPDDFSHGHLISSGLENLLQTIKVLNDYRDAYIHYWDNNRFVELDKKDIWYQMIQLLPSNYNQTRNIMLNYEVLSNIYISRKYHKLDEWRDFCKWIETIPMHELVMEAI